MKEICRVLTILLFVIFLCQTDALAAQPELNYDQTELNEKVDAFIDEFGEKTVGANLSLFTAEEVLLERFIGFQDREADIQMGEETVVEWGSVTKLLTWISVMQMVEKGEIDLDEDIQTYLPAGFLTNLRYQEPLTMLHLMNHNAGFQEELVDIMVQDIGDVLPLEDALAKRKPAQVFKPGEFTAYSNWGTALAAFIVERVSGEDFADYVHNHIFEPLGMESTAIRPGLSDNAWVLGQREKLSCYRENGALYPDSFLHIPLYPAGMATGTLGDFRLFAQSLLVQEGEGSPLFDRPQTFAFMVSPSSTFTGTEIPRNCHGFWFQDLGRNIIGHGGNTAGCTSHLLLDLEAGVGYVVMTNQQNETTYNIDLPKQLFGEFSESAYYDPDRELPKSMFYSARGIFEGPLKFSNVMLASMEEKDKTALWAYAAPEGIGRIEMPYMDLIELTTPQVISKIALPVLVAIGAVYGLITLIVGGLILKPLQRRKQKKLGVAPTPMPYRKWNYLACALLLLFLVNLTAIIWRIMEFHPGSSYRIHLFIAIGIVVGMALLILLLLRGIRDPEQPRNEKLKYIATIFFLIAVITATFVYELYQFWAI